MSLKKSVHATLFAFLLCIIPTGIQAESIEDAIKNMNDLEKQQSPEIMKYFKKNTIIIQNGTFYSIKELKRFGFHLRKQGYKTLRSDFEFITSRSVYDDDGKRIFSTAIVNYDYRIEIAGERINGKSQVMYAFDTRSETPKIISMMATEITPDVIK